jgi:FkbM family methyltransferase
MEKKELPRTEAKGQMSWIEAGLLRLPYSITERVLFGSHFAARNLQTAIQHLLGGQRPVSFCLDGFVFHCLSSHKYFFQREHYERDLWALLSRIVTSQDIVYDVGAHYGYWILRLSRTCNHVFAFEPSPENFKQLAYNVSSNPISNVTIVNAACSATAGELHFSDEGSMAHIAERGILVPAITLDTFAGGHPKPTLILMDVEGFAGEVIRGASEVLSHGPKVVCEIHDPQEQNAVIPVLRQLGYRVNPLGKDHRFPFRIFAGPPVVQGEHVP